MGAGQSEEETEVGQDKVEREAKKEKILTFFRGINKSILLNDEVMEPFLKYVQTEVMSDSLLEKIEKAVDSETERRRAIESLRELNSKLEEFVFDVDCKSTTFVEFFREIMEKNKEDLKKLKLSELYHWLYVILPALDDCDARFYEDEFRNILNEHLEER